MTTYYDNVKKVRKKFNGIQPDHLKNVFKSTNIIFAQKQPRNLLRLLPKGRFDTYTNNFIQPKGLFKCTDKRCKICSLYVNEDNSFVMSSNMRWKLCSNVTCRVVNVMHKLKCNTCDHSDTYIGKMVGDKVVGFKSRIIQLISDCRTGLSICKFLICICHENKCLNEQYFQLNINDESKRQSAIRVL